MKQVFESERIRFVEVSEELVRDYLVMVNDEEHVNRFIRGFIGGSGKSYTEEQEREWVRSKQKENALVFSMIEKESGAFIGNIELMDVSEDEGELGIALTAAMQDKGYGTEAVQRLIRYAFEEMNLKRVRLRTRPFNRRAIHVYETCGFREYARTEDHICMEYRREHSAD